MARVIRREVFMSAKPYSLRDVKSQADGMIEQAREQAEAILREAREQTDRLFEKRKAEGHRKGFDEGRAAGLDSLDQQIRRDASEAAHGKMDKLTGALAEALTAFDAQKRRMLAAAESGLIELACAIARRVCKAVPDISLEAARANVRTVLEMAKHEHDVRLHVHSADLEGLREYAADLCGQIDRLEHIELVGDDAVSRGGCVLHGKAGSIDASIDTQLQHVADSLLHAPASAEAP